MKKLMMRTRLLLVLLVGMGLLWFGLAVGCPAAQQTRVFYCKGLELCSDFAMPKICASAEQPYAADGVDRKDRCYPALGYLVVRPFPADSAVGGLLFSGLGAIAFLLAAGLLLKGVQRDAGLAILAVALSAPFLFSLERANQIWLSVAGVMTFVAWFESESRFKRQVAIFALAFACALKLVPGVFLLLLVDQRRWRDIAICLAEGSALLLLPFAWAGGIDGIMAWLACMQDHLAYYVTSKAIGFSRIVRMVILYGTGGEFLSTSPSFRICRILDLAVGGMALVRFFWCRDRRQKLLLLAAAAVLIPGAAQYYTLLYFVPVLLLAVGKSLSVVEMTCWMVILCPLQLVFRDGALNQAFANLAVLILVLRDIVLPQKGSVTCG